DGRDVVGEGPEQVGLDCAQCFAGEPDRVHRGPQVPAHEGDVGGLDGDVGAGAHRQAQVGLGQCWGVVDAVADHRDDLALALESGDDVDLVLGQDLGDDLLDADLGGDPTGHGLVVAGEQDRSETQVLQALDRLGAGGLDSVGDDEDPAGLSVPADGDDGLTFVLGRGLGGCDIGGEVLGPVGQQG